MKISKKIVRSLVGVAFASTLSASLVVAQQPQTGYHSVACFKVKPDKGAADFRTFIAEESHKLAQGRVDDGEITTWYLLRSVLPQGTSADCDYLVVAMFPGAPHMLGTQELSAGLMKAGMSITPEDYINHRNAVSTLVNVGIYQNIFTVGSPRKGDYFLVYYMKTSNLAEYVAFEKRVLLPVFDAMTKDGSSSACSFNVRVLPGGTDQPFQAVTVSAVPTMDAAIVFSSKFADGILKMHSDTNVDTIFDQLGKLRTIHATELYQLEDVITK